MNFLSTEVVKDFIIPAYNFYSIGITDQKTPKQQYEYIKKTTLVTGARSVSNYVSTYLERYYEDDTVQLIFGTILNSAEALSKLDVVSDGSYRCNRLLFNTVTGEIKLTGGNLERLNDTYLGSSMYHAYYPLTEEGVLSWIKGNERLFIQNSYNFSDRAVIIEDDYIENDRFIDFSGIDYEPTFHQYIIDEKENTKTSVIGYVESKLYKNLVPYYSDYDQSFSVSLEEYNEILKSKGYSKYIF